MQTGKSKIDYRERKPVDEKCNLEIREKKKIVRIF
jgi:hypothetical protein